MGNVVGALVAPIVMPALVIPLEADARPTQQPGRLEFFTLNGLDSVQITAQRGGPTAQPAEQRFLVVMLGNAARMDAHLSSFTSMSRSFDATVVAFDPRGVGSSSGWPCSFHDLVDDTVAQVDRLLANNPGVSAHQITLYGQSLGGAVACYAARDLHARGQPVRLIADRTFAHIDALARHFVHILAHQIALRVPLIAIRAAGALAGTVLPLTPWCMRPVEPLLLMPADARICVLNHEDDSMIPPRFALHCALPVALQRRVGFWAQATRPRPGGRGCEHFGGDDGTQCDQVSDNVKLTDWGFIVHEMPVDRWNFMFDAKSGSDARSFLFDFIAAGATGTGTNARTRMTTTTCGSSRR